MLGDFTIHVFFFSLIHVLPIIVDGFYKVAELKGVSEYEIQASSRCGGLGEEVRWNFLCVGDEGRGGGEWREGRWSQARIKPCSNFCVGT